MSDHIKEVPGLVHKRSGLRFVADLGEGQPVEFKSVGNKIRVTRDGKTAGWITNGVFLRVIYGQSVGRSEG